MLTQWQKIKNLLIHHMIFFLDLYQRIGKNDNNIRIDLRQKQLDETHN